MTAWLHIAGIGEDGPDGQTPATRAVVTSAKVIVGGKRHQGFAEDISAMRIAWPRRLMR